MQTKSIFINFCSNNAKKEANHNVVCPFEIMGLFSNQYRINFSKIKMKSSERTSIVFSTILSYFLLFVETR